ELFLAGLRDEQENRHRFLEIMDERLESLAEALRKRAAETPLEPVAPEDREAPIEEADAQTADWPAEEAVGEEAVPEDAATEPTAEAPSRPAAELASDGPGTLDPGLADIFLEEFDEVSGALDELLPAWRDKSDNRALLVEIRRSFHTLKGSGRMVGATELGEFAWHIEEMLNKVLESPVDDYGDLVVMVELARAALPALRQRLLGEPAKLERAAIHAIAAEAERLQSGAAPDWGALKPSLPPALVELLPDEAAASATKVEAAESRKPEPATPEPPSDARVAELARAEFREHLATLEALQHDETTDVLAAREHVMAAHGLSGSPGLAGQSDAVVLARALEELLDLLKRQPEPLNATERDALREAITIFHRHLRRMDGDADAPRPHGEAELVRHLHALTAQRRKRGARAPERPAGAVNEVLGFFLEEAQEVLGRCDSLLNDWRDRLDDITLVQNLQREIHTFKGGARMAGLTALGEISHAMETLLERIANHQAEATVAAVEVLESGCDRLNTWVEQLARGETPDTGKAVTLFLEQVEALEVVPGAAVADEAEEAEAHELEELPEEELLEEEALEQDDDFEEDFEDVDEDETAEIAEQDAGTEAQPAPARAGREMADSAAEDAPGGQQVRVAADLLDRLVNAAGEISICRSRLEQQVGSFRFNLKEFDQTVARLRDQLRKLEIETEAQILSRYQRQPEENGADFDPLELDRFSTIQQLSRALSESVADLLNLQEMLEETARHSEALLTQQSRVSNELQEGLMQARMVRFAAIAPRLRRVVRAAAEESKKNARLQLRVIGTSDQLDRNVLERITAPLEHMLRNSVVHGIERPKLRRSRRKRKDGEITITVSSEATEFVIRVEDDGNGLDLDAIRKRAVERGLADEDAELQPHQLMEFILQPGFSTSQKVTGLAGRGVGMDVVDSEIRQIGGSIEIDSKPRHGTCFTIRIPFSLAVMQAIGVTVGEQRYYIPVASVGGVSRMLPEDYRKLVEQEKPTWEFAGQSYPVLELEPLLGAAPEPLGEDNVSLLMIRAGDQRAAFRVTQLLGHREIVVKPVGPQVSSVPGILGGTISADGLVMLILDMGPLIRRGLLHGAPRVVAPAPVARWPSKPLVMVVDDSITMRKVTTRVLERQAFDVVTANDGVDASAQLQERAPDLILL
ncbi:MAG: Hpt domain-containing protein, partial [Xanthomonadales bacterium]|nr:Hpt domain-containing protein [Xanthomonadales bacterium]